LKKKEIFKTVLYVIFVGENIKIRKLMVIKTNPKKINLSEIIVILQVIIIYNNKANILRGGLQSPNGGFQEGPQKIKAKIQLKV